MTEPLAVVTMREVADVLALHGGALPCTPDVEVVKGDLVITLRVHQSINSLELSNQLRYLLDVATLRAIEQRYDMLANRLASLLQPPEES